MYVLHSRDTFGWSGLNESRIMIALKVRYTVPTRGFFRRQFVPLPQKIKRGEDVRAIVKENSG